MRADPALLPAFIPEVAAMAGDPRGAAIRKEVAGLLEGVGSLAPAAMVTLAEGRCVAQWGVVQRRC